MNDQFTSQDVDSVEEQHPMTWPVKTAMSEASLPIFLSRFSFHHKLHHLTCKSIAHWKGRHKWIGWWQRYLHAWMACLPWKAEALSIRIGMSCCSCTTYFRVWCAALIITLQETDIVALVSVPKHFSMLLPGMEGQSYMVLQGIGPRWEEERILNNQVFTHRWLYGTSCLSKI